MQRRLVNVAAELNLPFTATDRLYNTRLAQELGLWAESKGKGDRFHPAVFRAYFAEGKNIGQASVLLELAASVGLPGDEAAGVLKAGDFKAAVDADWSLSRERMITAVPTFLLNGDRLVGAQPYQALEELLERNRVPRRSDELRMTNYE